MPVAKERRAAYYRQWRLDNPEKTSGYLKNHRLKDPARNRRNRWRERLNSFGLTDQDWEHLILRSEGRCEICGVIFDDSSRDTTMCFDHCHETNVVRGLLCGKHNRALGMFGDNEDGVWKVLQYLQIGGKNPNGPG